MRIAMSVSGHDLSAVIDPRFGRAAGFLTIDSESMEYEYRANPNMGAAGGAGISTAQMVIDWGVQTIITGHVGPNAFKVLEAAGIVIHTGAAGTAAEALDAFKRDQLPRAGAASVGEHFGMGAGGSTGATGRGSGRGMGRGGQRW